MSATEIVIASAKRTAVGSFNGAFANTPAHELGAAAIKAALASAKLEPGEVDEVILGQILQAGEGQNPARQAAMKAGIPQEKTAFGLNQLCGSGLRAVAIGLQQIANGDAKIIVAGGQELMSQAPHVAHLRNGVKMGDMKFIDSMIKDGLTDAFHGYHMGNTAENIATKWQLTREEQDRFATGSQNKAEAAQKAGRFKDEIAPFTVASRKGDVVVVDDEFIRPGTTYEALAKLRPAFSKEGTVTAGNASGINDGAAALGADERGRGGQARPEAAGANRLVGDGGRRSRDHGNRPDSRLAQGAGACGLVGEGPRSRRGQRGLRGAGARRQQGHGLGPRDRQRQWRGDRHRSSDRRLGRARIDDAVARNGAAQRQEGPRDALHRRGHGNRADGRALRRVRI